MRNLLYIIPLAFHHFVYSQKPAKTFPCYDFSEILKVEPTLVYKPHLDASRSFSINILKNTSQVQKYIKSGKLRTVKKSGNGYRLQKLEYSRPYLVPKAKKTLEKIGARFSRETKGSTFTVSSITRTLEDQCRLRKVNTNASMGISSHNYGNSFDISYIRFNGKLSIDPKTEVILEKVLNYYLSAGRIFYIKEKQQSCFHVTVKNY